MLFINKLLFIIFLMLSFFKKVLEKLVLGVVHCGIYKVVIMILSVILLGYFILIPCIKQFFAQAIKED